MLIPIKTFVSAVAGHLANNSVIDRIDIYNKQIFKKLWEVINDKLQHLDELGNGEGHAKLSAFFNILVHTNKTNLIYGSSKQNILSHFGGKTLIQNLKENVGDTDIETMAISRHKSLKGLIYE